MKLNRKILLVLALAIGVVAPATVGVGPASAAVCPLNAPTYSSSDICADAVFITGSGRVYVKASILSGAYYAVDIQTKTGTQPWVRRCQAAVSPSFCSGFAGFATPTNTKVRLKAYRTSTNYAYFDVPIVQV